MARNIAFFTVYNYSEWCIRGILYNSIKKGLSCLIDSYGPCMACTAGFITSDVTSGWAACMHGTARGMFWEDQAACGDKISRHKEYIRSDTYDIIYNYDPKMVIVAASKHTGLAQAP